MCFKLLGKRPVISVNCQYVTLLQLGSLNLQNVTSFEWFVWIRIRKMCVIHTCTSTVLLSATPAADMENTKHTVRNVQPMKHVDLSQIMSAT